MNNLIHYLGVSVYGGDICAGLNVLKESFSEFSMCVC